MIKPPDYPGENFNAKYITTVLMALKHGAEIVLQPMKDGKAPREVPQISWPGSGKSMLPQRVFECLKELKIIASGTTDSETGLDVWEDNSVLEKL